ncbi:MAG: hypothetical protein C3F18_12260 [Nitrosomonadales bacterium]|nr:MAG: hypothetical protein C3F18_12260 [Nitrosomonadales bacterium]
MSKIFISYRSADRAYSARLKDRLIRKFGEENVFFDKDRDSIEPSSDFPETLDATIRTAEIVLAVVGPGWLSDASLKRLNHDANDFVRRELQEALQRRERSEALTVLPLTVGNVAMPDARGLPVELSAFTSIQANQLRDDPDFDEDIADICDIIATRCPGLRARRQNDWLRGILTSDEQSRASLGQDIAVCKAGRHITKRPAASAVLDVWWQSWPVDHRAFVLLGEEGDGKSWAVADWLADRVAGASFPIPVVVAPAHKLAQASVKEILAACLEVSQPCGNWLKRLEDLENDPPGEVPLFLLVVDAFNERPGLGWRELFDTLRTSPWRERVALIGLCRKEYWQGLAIPDDGLPLAWTLSGFTSAELDEALAQRGATREQFNPEVLHWMLRPRYFDLAFRLKDEISQGGLTLDRLIYEDWRDMAGRKQQPLSHEDFLTLISGLAEKLEQRRIANADFTAQAQLVTGNVHELLRELSSAGVIERRSGKLLFGSRHLALALGLVLANSVEECQDQSPAALRENISRYMSSYAESDLQVRVCAMALFHALSSRNYPETGRLALLRAWIGGRNLDETDLDKIAAYLPLQPSTYLRMAEYIWGEADNREAQNAFMIGFLRHRHCPEVSRELRPAFARWLGFVYPWGYRAHYERDDVKLAELWRGVENRLGGPAISGPVKLLGVTIEITENIGLLRLAQVALAVMSHDRSQGYADQLLAGLVAATVMDGSHGEFSWLLHTCHAETANLLLVSARDWLEQGRYGQSTAYLAARKLLMCLGSEEARQLLNTIPVELRFIHPLVQMREENPCDFFGGLWTEVNYLDCLDRSKKHGSLIARQLKEVVLNPEIDLPSVYRSRLDEAGAGLDLSQVGRFMGKTREQYDLEEMEPALCAFAVSRYRDLMRILAQEVKSREGLSLRLLTWDIIDQLPILGDEEQTLVLTVWKSMLTLGDEESRLAELVLFSMVVFDQPVVEQLKMLKERSDRHGYFVQHPPCFHPLSAGDGPAVVGELRNIDLSQTDQLSNLLWYLTKTLRHADAGIREHLLTHFDVYDPVARGCCLEIFVQTNDTDAARKIILSGWAYRDGCNHALENHWGSLLLAEYGESLSLDNLVGRIQPEWLGYAIKKRGYRSNDVVGYAAVLDRIWRGIVARAPSPEIDSLSPYVRIESLSTNERENDQLSAHEIGSTNVRFTNNTWGGRAGQGSVEDLRRLTDLDANVDRLNSLSQQVADLEEHERARGNPWFADSFRHGGLEQVLALDNTHWQDWIAPVLRNDGRARQLLALCRGFYEKLCSALLAHAPQEGLQLFRVLATQSTIRITAARLDLRVLLLDVFAAPASPEVEQILHEQIEAASTDFDLFEFALYSQYGERNDWVRNVAKNWIASGEGYDKARGLSLLGFSAAATDGDSLAEWISDHPDSWLRDVAEESRRRHQRHIWARRWFERFLTRKDRCEAWAAFRLFLHCVDRRFWLWFSDSDLGKIEPWKHDAITMNLGAIESTCKSNEKNWQDSFLGQKVKPDELWPWMRSYG